MPKPRLTLKYASLSLMLLPILALSQNGGSLPASAGKQDKPGNPPPQSGTTQAPPATSVKTGPQGPGLTTPPVHATIPDPGDAWDSLKLDSKVRIKLDFRNANVDNIIAMIQKASHVTIVKDPQLTGNMTVTTADPVSLTEAFHVFQSVLRLRGFEFSRDRKILIITLTKKPQPPPPPPQPIIQMTPPVDTSVPIVKFYPLQFASATQVARAINEVFAAAGPPNPQQFGMVFGRGGQPQPGGAPGPSVRASYEEFSNSVIVHAPAAQQTEVADLIKQIDKLQTQPLKTKSYDLVYATATDVLPTVQSVLEANASKGKGSKDSSNNFFPFFFGFGGGGQNQAVADSRTNTIIVTGTDEQIALTDKLIEGLDHRVSVVSTTFVFPLQNARADAVANLLTAAFGLRQGVQQQGRNTPITPTNNVFNNTAPSSTTSRAGGDIGNDKNLALKMQDPNAESGDLLTSVGVTQMFTQSFGFDGGGSFGGRGRGRNGESVGHDTNGKVVNIHDLTGQVTAIADPNTNAVIIVTNPDNVELIQKVLDQLDKLPEQVMIQTIVVEATLDRSKQFGVEWNFAKSKILGNQGTKGVASQTFGLQGANPALQGFSYALTGGDLTAFFNMLQTDTKFQVLSTPRIFTTNNMEAQINISQKIPYIVSTIQNINGTNSFNYGFQDVGIVLTVTPHITSNGYVTMDVLQTANDLQGYTTFNAPIVNQREAETTVSAKDGETIILGGMIRNQITSTMNKIPLLGDIPVLGSIFRNHTSDNQKTELLVFLTPRVVKDPAEAKRLLEETKKDMNKDTSKLLKQDGKILSGNHKGS